MTDTVVVSIRVHPDVWKTAKKYAIDKDLTIGQLVEAALLHEIQRK
jgi:hypothetical protein